MESKVYKLYLQSLHAEVSILDEGHAKWMVWSMPNYTGVGGDRLTLLEVQQLRNFCDTVENMWPKKSLTKKEE